MKNNLKKDEKLFDFSPEKSILGDVESNNGYSKRKTITTTIESKIMLKPVNRDVHVSRKQGWHGMSNVVDKITKENCKVAYPMEKRQLSFEDSVTNEAGETITKLVKTDSYHIVSMDDRLPIGDAVGEDYKLVGNVQMIDMITESLGGTSHEIESVGTFKDRAAAYASIRLDKEFLAGGRMTESVLNIMWGHGGLFSVTAKACFNVISCLNSLRAALRYKSNDFKFDFKHTGNVIVKLANMKEAIEAQYGVVAEFKRTMESLASVECGETTAKEIFAGFLHTGGNRLTVRTENRVNRLVTLHKTGKGNDGKTMLDAFNAITDFFSHESSSKADETKNRWKQFESSEIGAAANHKERAYELFKGNRIDNGDMETIMARGKALLAAPVIPETALATN